MANVGGRVIVNRREVDALLRSGEVGRELGRSGEVGTQEAKRLAPVSPSGHDGMRSGHLRNSLHWEVDQDGKGLFVDIIAGDSDVDLAEVLAVEFGTGPHVIESHGDYPLRNAKGQVFGKRVHHPGTHAQPFLQPGLERAARG
jgi:hypothetical protein